MQTDKQELIDSDASPRAFVTGAGFVFQIVGGIHLTLGLVYLVTNGLFSRNAAQRIDTWRDYFATSNITDAISAMGMLMAVAGGLALIATGFGMQGERPGSAGWGMLTSTLLTIAALAAAVTFGMAGGAWVRCLLAILHAAANAVLFMLAGHSRTILKEHPPPADQNVVDDEWLEAHARRRRQY